MPITLEEIKKALDDRGMVLELLEDMGSETVQPSCTALILGKEVYESVLDETNDNLQKEHKENARLERSVGTRQSSQFEPRDNLPIEVIMDHPLTRSAVTRPGALKLALQAWQKEEDRLNPSHH